MITYIKEPQYTPIVQQVDYVYSESAGQAEASFKANRTGIDIVKVIEVKW